MYNITATCKGKLNSTSVKQLNRARSLKTKEKVNFYFLLPTGLPTDSAGILALPAGRSE